MRHHWLLLGACGWVLLLLIFASKFLNFSLRRADGGQARLDWDLPVVETKLYSTQQPAKSEPRSDLLGKSVVDKNDDENTSSTTLTLLSSVDHSGSDPDWQDVNKRRLEMLSEVCKNSSLWNLTHTTVRKFVLDRIFVCDKYKILFCQTPKVGNTQWKKVLIVLNGKFSSVEVIPENLVHDHERNGLPRLSSMSNAQISQRLNSYFKFFIVRDPFERLISAFKDKFVKNPRFEPWYKQDIAPAIVHKYRQRPGGDNDSLSIKFEEFVRYLGDRSSRKFLDRKFGDHIIHWITYAELCAPCDISYNVVGHHETLESDAPYILRAAGIEHLVSYPSIPPGITRYNRSMVEHFFTRVRKRDVLHLYTRYQGDFSMFGYPRPNFLLD